MQKKLLVAALGTLFTLPVLAADAPASPNTFTSNVSLVSDYLYRGISQTGQKPAIQGGFDYAHASGFYAGVWGSSISWISDLAVATNAGVELDTYLGFKNSLATDVGYDVGFLRYNYPGTYAPGATKADTDEIYGAISYKWLTAKYSYALGDTFGTPNAKGTSYFDLSASYAVPDTGVTLGAHYGKQTFKGSTADALKATTIAGVSQDPTYSDYKLSVTKDLSGYALGLTYSKSNAKTGGVYTVLGKDLGRGTAVVSLSRTF
ncbi:MAG: hypothetical protein HY306_00795 [Nitrosomonadales bacterium]|nr:hypothetical protein [Nitrosomonadales bacterium]